MRSRPGTAYMMTLTVCAVAATTAVSGLALRAASADRGRRVGDLAGARLLAQSGIEATLQRIEEDADWRNRFGSRLIDTVPLGDGDFQIAVFDPADNDLSDDPNDAYRLICRGRLDGAESTLSVDVVSLAETYRDRVIAAAPIRYWPLDETSGNTATDLMGNDNAAHTGAGTLNQISGYDGGPAPLYDSTDEFSWDLHHDDLLLANGTVMCWVYCLGNVAGDQTIFAKTRERGTEGEFIIAIVGDDLQLTASITNNKGNQDTITLGKITPNTWTHVAVSFGQSLEGFVNGVGADWNNKARSDWASPGNIRNIQIGAVWPDLLLEDTLNGSVRDVAIFDSQLVEKDIAGFLADPAASSFAIDPDSWAWVVE